jgi:glucuronyl/N-acetylglucosaminyl transferase EXT1
VKDDFELLARNSTFTVAPAGYGKWTYRFFNAIQWGSIPVLISDDYIKPFNSSIPYESFSIVLLEKDILNIDHILRSISAREVERYQENLKANQSKFTRRVFFELLVRELESIRH